MLIYVLTSCSRLGNKIKNEDMLALNLVLNLTSDIGKNTFIVTTHNVFDLRESYTLRVLDTREYEMLPSNYSSLLYNLIPSFTDNKDISVMFIRSTSEVVIENPINRYHILIYVSERSKAFKLSFSDLLPHKFTYEFPSGSDFEKVIYMKSNGSSVILSNGMYFLTYDMETSVFQIRSLNRKRPADHHLPE